MESSSSPASHARSYSGYCPLLAPEFKYKQNQSCVCLKVALLSALKTLSSSLRLLNSLLYLQQKSKKDQTVS